MNKKLLGLVAAFFVTGAQAGPTITPTSATVTPGVADFRTVINYPVQTFPEYQSVEEIKALNAALGNEHFRKEYQAERCFQRNSEAAVLSFVSITFGGILVCALMEWFQEYKVKTAEKAERIAGIQHRIQQLRAQHSRA